MKDRQGTTLDTPRSVSRITCIVNQQYREDIIQYLNAIKADALLENGRTLREYIRKRSLVWPRTRVKLESSASDIFSFTVPEKDAYAIMCDMVQSSSLHIPGRGTVFMQDIQEYGSQWGAKWGVSSSSTQEDPRILKDLACVNFVLSGRELGEKLAQTALDLGVCVPLLTYGFGNDLRDQLGLIRVAISPDKEIVQLVIPKQDSESIIRLLAEDAKLDNTVKGYIYELPVKLGLIDTRLKVGQQSQAATIDQIIAAIDTIKMGTDWRKRLDPTRSKKNDALLPKQNCELAFVSEEDQVEGLKEVCNKLGALGFVSVRVSQVGFDSSHDAQEDDVRTLVRSTVCVSREVCSRVVDTLMSLDKYLCQTVQVLCP